MKVSSPKKKIAKIALALTWDGARWPLASLPPRARAFLSAKGYARPSRREVARLFEKAEVAELRICWVPRLKGGDDTLAEIFAAPGSRRVPFRAVRSARFGDYLAVTYAR